MSDKKKSRIPGFIGPSYSSRVQRENCQRTVNMYLEMDALGMGKADEPAMLISTPGLKYHQTIGTGPIRALYTCADGQTAYVVSGADVFQISAADGPVIQMSGQLTTTTGPVSVADNGIEVVFVDGEHIYYVTIGDVLVRTVRDSHAYPADVVTYQDFYFIFNHKGTNSFFISDLNSVTFLPLNVANKAGKPDPITGLIAMNQKLYVMGASSCEMWYNAGTSGSTPFLRQPGAFSQIGCVAPHSIAKTGETFCWLGSNDQGGGVVYQMGQGLAPNRVSTHAIEFAIQSNGDLTNATAFSYQQEGHYFYCLNIPGCNVTWVFDTELKQWHERSDVMDTQRHYADTHCVLNDRHLVGDYRNGNLYTYELDVHTNNGEPVKRLRQSPHISSNMQMMYFTLFEVDAEFGVGDLNGEYQNPQLWLQTSDDGGETWSTPRSAPLGKTGIYKNRARWTRLGRSRDRVFRVFCTDPVKLNMLSADLDGDNGTS